MEQQPDDIETIKPIAIEFELKVDDMVTLGVFHQKHSPEVRRRIFWHNVTWLLVMLLVPILVCIVTTPRGSNPLPTAYRHWPLFLMAPLYVLASWIYYTFFDLGRQIRYFRAWYSTPDNQTMLGLQKITIQPDGLLFENRATHASFQWSAFKKIVVTESYAYLFVHSVSAFVIPRNAFPEAVDFDRFVDTVRQSINRTIAD
ncbi:MAG: YcxB family protein [Planctomycetales bacterium]